MYLGSDPSHTQFLPFLLLLLPLQSRLLPPLPEEALGLLSVRGSTAGRSTGCFRRFVRTSSSNTLWGAWRRRERGGSFKDEHTLRVQPQGERRRLVQPRVTSQRLCSVARYSGADSHHTSWVWMSNHLAQGCRKGNCLQNQK
jgi:hypothetical protein